MFSALETIDLTPHASVRMTQRNFTAHEIEYILLHGSWFSEGADEACILRTRDIPRNEWSAFGYLAGTKIALYQGSIKTLYRNRTRLS